MFFSLVKLFLFSASLVDAATCGEGSVGDGICSDGKCCSKWGWCGDSIAHCGPKPPTPIPPTPTASPPTSAQDHDSRLIAYLGNWDPCPSTNQVAQYTHIVIAFAVSYQYREAKNLCNTSCDIAQPYVCGNNANPALVSEWKRAGKKVILSFGGAGMGGSWNRKNDCWEYCYGKETKVVDRLVQIVNNMGLDGVDIDFEYYVTEKAVNFLNQVTIGLRNKLPAGSEITHAPMDSDVIPGKRYYDDVLKVIGNHLDFLMPQYYNGYTRPAIDGIGGTGEGRMSALSHYNAIVNGIFGGDAKKMVFGFCIYGCEKSDATASQAVKVMTDLASSHPCNGGAFFWVAKHDTNGWSSEVGSTIQRLSSTNKCSSGGSKDVSTGVYYIKSVPWNTYLRMHPHGDVDMAGQPLPWEKMYVQKRGGNKYSIKSQEHGNMYVRVDGPGEGRLVNTQTFPGPWEEFYIEMLDNGRVAFRSVAHNNYLRAWGPSPGSNVDTQTFIGSWEQFTLSRAR